MNKKKLVLFIASSVLALAIFVVAIYFATKPYTPSSNDDQNTNTSDVTDNNNEVVYDGEIVVEVKDVEGNVIKSVQIKFKNGDRLVDLIAANFNNFTYQDSQYGAYVTSVESIVEDNDAHIYVALYLNGEYATSGINTLEYKDGSVITLKAETW